MVLVGARMPSVLVEIGFMTNSANVNTALAQFVPTPMTANTVSDCLFNWAELHYPQFFTPPGAASANYAQYYYRYYPGKANYLAISAEDNHAWVLGPVSGNTPADVGAVANYQSTAGCTK